MKYCPPVVFTWRTLTTKIQCAAGAEIVDSDANFGLSAPQARNCWPLCAVGAKNGDFKQFSLSHRLKNLEILKQFSRIFHDCERRAAAAATADFFLSIGERTWRAYFLNATVS